MTLAGWLQLAALIAFIVVGTRLLGPYIAGIFSVGVDAPEKRPLGDRFFWPVERLIYRLCRHRRAQRSSGGRVYALSLLAFSLVSVLVVYALPAACRARCRSTPTASPACRRRCRSTPRSAS